MNCVIQQVIHTHTYTGYAHTCMTRKSEIMFRTHMRERERERERGRERERETYSNGGIPAARSQCCAIR